MGNLINGSQASQMGGLSMVLGGVQTATDAASQLFSGIGQAQQYGFQADLARRNAAIARGDEASVLAAGAYEQSVAKLKAGQTIAGQKVAFAANGIDVSQGTPAAVEESTRKVSAIDIAMMRYNTSKAVYGLENEAAQGEAQAAIYDRAAKNSKRVGYTKAADTILGGVSSLSNKWAAYKQSGVK